MSLTFDQANDDILTILKTAWDATGHEMFYDSVREQRESDMSPWGEVFVRHAAGGQGSLGGQGKRIFLRRGIVFVTIHIPSGSGLSVGYQLAKVVADAYEGVSSPNGVWFRNVRISEQGRDGTFYQIQVLVDFEYHEIK